MKKNNLLFLSIAVICCNFISFTLQAMGNLEEWEIIKKTIYIENNSFFPLKISYKKPLQKAKFLEPDLGTGAHGPMQSIRNPEKIKGNIIISIAMPETVTELSQWSAWLKNNTGIDLGESWYNRIKSVLGVVPVLNLIAYLLSFKIEIDPQQYAGGAILHIFWPLLQTVTMTGPWIMNIEYNSTTDLVWRTLRHYTSPIIQSTQKTSLDTFHVLKSWLTFDLPQYINSKKISATSSEQDILRLVPAKIKTLEGWSERNIIEDYYE
jgi:hypothetical protein